MTESPSAQDLGHPGGYDYETGSPHLRHHVLRRWMVDTIVQAVAEQFSIRENVRVLEIGGGHGSFTDHVLALGASVTITEMSSGSAQFLVDRYRANPNAKVLFDHTGDAIDVQHDNFDVILCVSVLHHIPDYFAAIRKYVERLNQGGVFLSFQDPLWYPTRSRVSMALDRGAYFAWRLRRGDLWNGLASTARRVSNRRSESNPRDMVEYHVLRQGCDQAAIVDMLQPEFESVLLTPYWSTQDALLQRLGSAMGLKSSFAIVAQGRRGVH